MRHIADESLSTPLLAVQGLRTYFKSGKGLIKAVDGVDLSLSAKHTLCVVGESGSGKSMTALSIMRLVDKPGYIAGGQILFEGRDIVKTSERTMRSIRGNKISMIFQEPMTSLNPVYSVGNQIMEAIQVHRKVSRKEARAQAIELLTTVGIPSPAKRIDDYPHKMSGGMRQRVMIAMGLALQPQLLIADEPTTALDVTIQAQILDLMRAMRQQYGTALLLITHDFGVVAEMADDVAVMYTGEIVEQGTVYQVIKSPKHPYTVGLLDSMPSRVTRGERLHVIPGTVPSPMNLPPGCPFAPRCPRVMDICREQHPLLTPQQDGSLVRCWHFPGIDAVQKEPQQ